jgi:hypothetical protein
MEGVQPPSIFFSLLIHLYMWTENSNQLAAINRRAVEENRNDLFVSIELATSLLEDPLMWRLLPLRWDEGKLLEAVWLARLPLRLPNSDLSLLMERGYQLASMRQACLAHSVFNHTGYSKNGDGHIVPFCFPYGNSLNQYTRFYAETSFGVGGIKTGPGLGGLWCIVRDGEKSSRIFGAENIFDSEIYTNFSKFVGMLKGNRVSAAEREILGVNYISPRIAGILSGLEAEPNEGYLLTKTLTAQELALYGNILSAIKGRLAMDSGITLLSPVYGDNNIAFAGGGGCSICSKLELITIHTIGRALQGLGLAVQLYPEYHGWTERKYYQTLG